MIYGSVCSGIEAASQAWQPLGWTPAFFSEIEKFPSAVLSHHYGSNMPDEPHSTNGVPNYGDMTNFKEWPSHAIDILVGGTPCQSFSVAGLRQGLDDPRGNLMLTFGAMAKRYQPKWIIWENVPGVLSSNKGRDFGTFLRLLGECGYGFAYRVLDAQYIRVDGFGRAIPQRRRRVFVVGCLGDWRRAAAVLFEPESMSGNTAPRRETRESVAGALGARTCQSIGVQDATSGHLLPEVFPTIDLNMDAKFGSNQWVDGGQFVYAIPGNWIGRKPENGGNAMEPMHNVSPCQTSTDRHAVAYANPVSPSIATGPPFSRTGNERVEAEAMIVQSHAVRRLMPVECERLQGFPDGFTQIPWRNKPAENCPDGARYKALGNSMAVNCMRWVGRRIEMIEQLQKEI